jgi:hypothetical protein
MAEQNTQQNRIALAVRITRRGGGQASETHAAVIAKAATMIFAGTHATSHIESHPSAWAAQGRSLIGTSHVVAHRPMQPRATEVWHRERPEIVAERRAR